MVTPARSSLADISAGLADAVAPHPLQRGSAEFRRVNGALFAAGFATFSLLYYVQPLLPSFADSFALSPAMSSLSLLLSAGLTLLAAAAPDWPSLLACRTLLGITLSGMPAVSMAYLSEE